MSELQNQNPDGQKVNKEYEPSEWQKIRYEWADKAAIRGLDNIQNALIRMITLSSGMLFGGIAFLKTAVSIGFQVWFLVCMMISLVVSLTGSIPSMRTTADDPHAIERNIVDIAAWKYRALIASIGVFLLALLIVGIGFLKSIN